MLEEVVQARAAAMARRAVAPRQQAASENVLSQALGRLFAVAEAYPDLKANENFLALQTELTATEDRIAAARRYYNANVRDLNTKVETVPPNIIAGLFKHRPRRVLRGRAASSARRRRSTSASATPPSRRRRRMPRARPPPPSHRPPPPLRRSAGHPGITILPGLPDRPGQHPARSSRLTFLLRSQEHFAESVP